MMEKQYEFVEVYFNGSFMSGRGRLDELLANGWKIVDQHDWVECEDGSEFEITKYKLEKTVRSGA